MPAHCWAETVPEFLAEGMGGSGHSERAQVSGPSVNKARSGAAMGSGSLKTAGVLVGGLRHLSS